MKCPSCGFREEDDALVCSRCGRVLKESEHVLSEEHEEQAKQAAKDTGRRNAIVAAVVVVVVALGGFTTYKLVVGPPAQMVGAWTNTGYGGLLALLSGGIKLQVLTETGGGKVTGTLSDNNVIQNITKGQVTGKKITATTETPTSYIYYTISGSIDANGELNAVVTEYNTDVTPVSKTPTSTTLVKASASGN